MFRALANNPRLLGFRVSEVTVTAYFWLAFRNAGFEGKLNRTKKSDRGIPKGSMYLHSRILGLKVPI